MNKPLINSNSEEYLIVDPCLDSFSGDLIDFNKLPKISFCIPVFNSARTLEKCLLSITQQNYPDMEIIIVDNGSTDESVEIAEKYSDKIYQDDGLLGSVRQKSVEKSNGTIIALFDSDIYIPHKNWLLNSIKFFNYSNEVSTVWPLNVAPPGAPKTTRLYFNLWSIFMNNRISKNKSVFGGGNALFLRSCIDEIGGIDKAIHWGEDFDWAQKLKGLGYKVIAINDPLYHDTMPSLTEFTKKQFIASDSFTKEGLDVMGLSKMDLIYENIVLGSKHMFKGLASDSSWILYPLFVSIRGLGFFYNFLRNR